jgi:hypothetical protein
VLVAETRAEVEAEAKDLALGRLELPTCFRPFNRFDDALALPLRDETDRGNKCNGIVFEGQDRRESGLSNAEEGMCNRVSPG